MGITEQKHIKENMHMLQQTRREDKKDHRTAKHEQNRLHSVKFSH